MGGASSTHGGDEKYKQFWSGNLKRRDHFGELGVDGRIIL
jgi:hypothetical protein